MPVLRSSVHSSSRSMCPAWRAGMRRRGEMRPVKGRPDAAAAHCRAPPPRCSAARCAPDRSVSNSINLSCGGRRARGGACGQQTAHGLLRCSLWGRAGSPRRGGALSARGHPRRPAGSTGCARRDRDRRRPRVRRANGCVSGPGGGAAAGPRARVVHGRPGGVARPPRLQAPNGFGVKLVPHGHGQLQLFPQLRAGPEDTRVTPHAGTHIHTRAGRESAVGRGLVAPPTLLQAEQPAAATAAAARRAVRASSTLLPAALSECCACSLRR